MIPQATVNTLRHNVNVSIGLYGIDCTLFVLNNPETSVDTLDDYVKPTDLTYTQYTTQVRIEWSPNIHRLKYRGLYVEGEIPIIVYFANIATDVYNTVKDVEIIKGSYIQISPQYIPDNFQGVEKYELVDEIINYMHDAVLVKTWKAVPMRLE